jgi:hypothetical protein
MTPIRLAKPVVVPQHSTFRFTFRLKNSDGSYVTDWTGWSGAWQIRETHASGTVLLSGTNVNSKLIFKPEGWIELTATHTETGALAAPKRCVIDIRLVEPTGDRLRSIEGEARITPGVTR